MARPDAKHFSSKDHCPGFSLLGLMGECPPGFFPSTLSYHHFCVPNWVYKRPKAFSYAKDMKKSAGGLQGTVSPPVDPAGGRGAARGETPGSSVYLGFENLLYFSFENSLNGQNHSSISQQPIKKSLQQIFPISLPPINTIWKTLLSEVKKGKGGMYPGSLKSSTNLNGGILKNSIHFLWIQIFLQSL